MKAARPGKRFRNAHTRAQHNGTSTGWGRILCFLLAAVCLVIGVILVFIPGPAFVFFILAGALLASQWRKLAEWLDRGEVGLRRGWHRFKQKWSRFRNS